MLIVASKLQSLCGPVIFVAKLSTMSYADGSHFFAPFSFLYSFGMHAQKKSNQKTLVFVELQF